MPRAARLAALALLIVSSACARIQRPAATPQRDWYEPSEIEAVARPYTDNPWPRLPRDVAIGAPGASVTVSVEYVVNRDGTVDASTFRNLTPDVDPRLVSAVRDAVLRWRFRPAWDRGRAVRMVLRQSFEFVNRPGR